MRTLTVSRNSPAATALFTLSTILLSLCITLHATAGVILSPTPKNGITVEWQTPEGVLLARHSSLLYWNDTLPSDATQDATGRWTLKWPDGIRVVTTPPAQDQYGETRVDLRITNTSDMPQRGTLFPPLTRWPRKDTAQVSPHHVVIRPPFAEIGTLGRQRAWFPREFLHDTASFQPADPPNWMLTAVLLGRDAGPELRLDPGQTATATLHLDVIPGDRNDALAEIYRRRGGYRVDPTTYDMSQYHDPTLAWVLDVNAAWITWTWDTSVMNPQTGEYRLFESLQAAHRKFGGYDVYMFWPYWPRAGLDARSQFDHYRDMPGGLEGLRAEIEEARKMLGTRFVLAHCHWSETSRDDSPEAVRRSYAQLVDTAITVGADGVVMDLMTATPEEIREMARARGRDLMPYAEFDPGWHQSQTNLVGRIHDSQPMPAFNLKRYMLPHHPQLRVCNPGLNGPRWERDFTLSFFNGHGIEINHLLGGSLPSSEPAFDMLAIILDIQRTNRAAFRSPNWQPLVRSHNPRVWINRWPTADRIIYTLVCTDPAGHQGPLVTLQKPPRPDQHVVDLWRQRPIELTEQSRDVVTYRLDPYPPGRAGGSGDYTAGCIVVLQRRLRLDFDRGLLTIRVDEPKPSEIVEIWRDREAPDQTPITRTAAAELHVDLYNALGEHTNEAIVVRLRDDAGQLVDLAVLPEVKERFLAIDLPKPTAPVDPADPPPGMIRVAPPPHDYIVQLGAPVWQPTYNRPPSYNAGGPSPPRRVTLAPFWIDRFPVTNADFRRFLDATNYRPDNDTNFLAHWTKGKIPEGLEDHPVVFVSYRDAIAYAAWAGKRLPTEEEWQAAAGWPSRRSWPWGDTEPKAELCNLNVGATTPVDAHPAGASPYGLQDLVGNVWQWTAPRYRSTHAEVVFLRGGSWYRPPPGKWFIRGGPRRINDHQPLPLFGPAMNRLATVGFRCAKDEAAK